LDAKKELNEFDARDSARARHYPYDPENADAVKRMLKLAADRLALVKDLEEWQSYYDADLVNQEKEIALSKLQQLFIAV
jgi:tRNA U38,U39,U40 pseudouridine synthase TruA